MKKSIKKLINSKLGYKFGKIRRKAMKKYCKEHGIKQVKVHIKRLKPNDLKGLY